MAFNKSDHWINKIHANYDRLSRYYDFISSSAELKISRQAINMIAERRPKKLLDIGSATGNSLLEAYKPGLKIPLSYGLELSYGMCLAAEMKIRKLELPLRPRIICGSALSSPFAASTFDAVLMSFTLELFPEHSIITVLEQIRLLLTNDGFFYLVYMADRGEKSIASKFYKFLHLQLPGIIDCRPIKAVDIIEQNGFVISDQKLFHLWGLPVGLIEARKEKEN